MTSRQVRILAAMAWLCVAVNSVCLAACMYSDHLAEQAGVSVSRILAEGNS